MIEIPEYKNAECVFRFFEEISKIPHGSGNTAKIAEYLVAFANERSLYCRRDEADNVIIKKGATRGYESRPTVIIQAHTDMVEAKTPECKKDLKLEGIDLVRDGDFLRARGTTLGADDGIGVAYALALLDSSDIPHPEIEAVFTSDEEIGLIGAGALSCDDLCGKTMINIDSDDEGVFTAGCAGGLRCDITLPVKRDKDEKCGITVSVSGLKGGHSGIEINEGGGNAIKILAEILSSLGDIQIASIRGGNADNAIPRSACATVYGIDKSTAEKTGSKIIEKYRTGDPQITINVENTEGRVKFFDSDSTKNLISLVCEEPSGVVAMSEDIAGLVETSLNLGIIESLEESALITFSIRSSKESEKESLTARVCNIAKSHGATASTHGSYPGWEYKKDSHLRDVMCRTYKDMYKKDAKVIVIHAGLECGIFAGKIKDLDCVSIGPDNFDLHTTDEHLSISSSARVWDFLKEVLKNI